MLSFKKIIYASLFFISACGFNPVYTDSNTSKLLGQISIQEPSTQNDFIFYSQLIDRFGDRGDKYTLSYAISTSTEDKALDFDGIDLIDNIVCLLILLLDSVLAKTTSFGVCLLGDWLSRPNLLVFRSPREATR